MRCLKRRKNRDNPPLKLPTFNLEHIIISFCSEHIYVLTYPTLMRSIERGLQALGDSFHRLGIPVASTSVVYTPGDDPPQSCKYKWRYTEGSLTSHSQIFCSYVKSSMATAPILLLYQIYETITISQIHEYLLGSSST
jgi:hypothetical protein